jgi:hypothetical protein
MPNGDDTAAPDAGNFESTGLRPGEKRYRVTNKKTGDYVNIVGPSENPDKAKLASMADAMLKRRQRISPVDIVDVPRGFAHGAISGLAQAGAPLAQATQAEMGEIPTAPGVEQTTQILERQIPGGYVRRPESGLGRMAASVSEFLFNPATWIGPDGPFMKAATAVTGGIGSFLGERIGGQYGHPALGALAGGGIGGGVTGALAPRGLPARPPRAVREATTEAATKAASKAGYKELSTIDYQMDPLTVATLRDAIIDHLTKRAIGEDRPIYKPEQIDGVMGIVKDMTTPSAVPGKIIVHDLERTRQYLNNERKKFGTIDADAANQAIEILDELMLNLPGVSEATEAARKNWAAYKRGQIVEETIAEAERNAKKSGTGANTDNTLRQAFDRRIIRRPRVWSAFGDRNLPEGQLSREQQEIMKILDPGRPINFARWLSRMGPRHILTAGVGGAGAKELGPAVAGMGGSAGGWMATHDPFLLLTSLTAGEIAHQVAHRAQYGRADRLAEITRARSPAGGYYTPRPLPSRPFTAATGAGRALGATALSPDTTERLELPEIVVRPPQ